jgi:prophage tail gpP-like protein
LGTPGVYTEAADFDEAERIEQIGVALDLNLTTGEDAATHAAAMLRKSYLEAPVAGIKLSGVHCGVQLYDVIELTDPQAGIEAATRRVIGYAWQFDRQHGRYEMTLTLGNL